MLESAYQHCLLYELQKAGLYALKEQPLRINYKEVNLNTATEWIVENKVLIEIKSVEALNPIHEAQILTYLRFSGLKIGLLINFNVLLLKNGLKRYVL